MSYAVAAGVQAAIHAHLTADAGLAATGAPVFDAAPVGAVPPLFVLIGAEEWRDRSAQGGGIGWLEVTLSVVGGGAGFQAIKQAAGAVGDAMARPLPALARGRISGVDFRRARARRTGREGGRRIDLRFRLRLEDI